MDFNYGTWSTKFEDRGGRNSITNDALKPLIPGFRVINASAISSAAGGGFIDIPDMALNLPEPGPTATAMNGLAPAYKLFDSRTGRSVMEFHSDVNRDLGGTADFTRFSTKLAANKLVRMADAGFVDNTAVAAMVRYLQDSNGGEIPSGFNIVAFDDLPVPQGYWDPGKNTQAFPTGGDVAGLFGFDQCTKDACSMQSNGIRHTSLAVFKFVGSSPQVFDCSGYFPGEGNECSGAPSLSNLYWSATGSERIMCGKDNDVEQALTYSRFEVTVNTELPGSQLFGIKDENNGVTGTLHVFAILGGTAAVVPGSETQYACYDTMIQGMVNNIKATGGDACDASEPRHATGNPCTLGDYLEHALGL